MVLNEEIVDVTGAISSELEDSDNNKSFLESQQLNDKRILVGVFSIPSELSRRSVIRFLFKTQAPPNMDLRFVFGESESHREMEMVKREAAEFNDVLILPIKENMNEGKSFTYFKYVWEHMQDQGYRFILKTDYDSIVHFRNLNERMQGMPHGLLYYGRMKEYNGWHYMQGMGYILSFDLIGLVVQSKHAQNNHIGVEDWTTAAWIWNLKRDHDINVVSDDDKFFDCPNSKGMWAGPFRHDVILYHWCKSDKDFLEVAQFWYFDSTFRNNSSDPRSLGKQ